MIALQSSSRFAPRPFLPGTDDREDEDTIEIQLTPGQVEELRNAAEEAESELAASIAKKPVEPARETAVPVVPPPEKRVEIRVVERVVPPTSTSSKTRAGRLYLIATGGAILLAVSVTIAYHLGARAHVTLPIAPAADPVITRPVHAPPSVPRPQAPAPVFTEQAQQQPPTPVRFANPFDASEVFEFPPGTPYSEARDAVAALLLERAHGRQTLSFPPDAPGSLSDIRSAGARRPL